MGPHPNVSPRLLSSGKGTQLVAFRIFESELFENLPFVQFT